MKKISIKATPFNFECNKEELAIMIIDMQRDFCYPGGFGEALGNDVEMTKSIIPTVKNLLDFARENSIFVIHTREGHRADLTDLQENKYNRGDNLKIGDKGPMGRILVRGEYGHDIVDELTPKFGEPIIDKPGKGAFFATDLDLILKNKKIKHIAFAGVTTHICVSTTIREANDRAYDCLLLTDCSAAFNKRDHEDTINNINQQGAIFGWSTDLENFKNAFK